MHLLACLSPHGYGHTAQLAPILNALVARHPDLRVTVRSTVPHWLLAARLRFPFTQVEIASDFGMVMANAVDVKAGESAAAYAAFHEHWEKKVDAEARALEALQPDLLVCNVPYLPLAGAARAGIPAAAVCSLNWADIYRHYCHSAPQAAVIHAQMIAAYASAAPFIRTTPAMPMSDLDNAREVGPIAAIGRDRREEILERIDAGDGTRLLLVAPGGIPTRWPVDDWPRHSRLRYLVQADWQVHHPDAVSLATLDMPFSDVLASSDALLGKPGYGSIAECVCNGVPMLYLPRGDWPEEPYLLEWLHAHGKGVPVSRAAIESGDLANAVDKILDTADRPALQPAGIESAADLLAKLLM